MSIAQDRIALINRLYGMAATVQVIDLYDAEGKAAGTRVELRIPLGHAHN